MSELLKRNSSASLQDAMATFRVVVLNGARQTGKTTLTKDLLSLPDNSWITLDDASTRQLAIQDPVEFISALPKPAVIDEFQLAGSDFLFAVKRIVDLHRQRGQLLLTGSANYLANKNPSDTLAGRKGTVRLWPLSMGEKQGISETFIDNAFEPGRWPYRTSKFDRGDVAQAILVGGYPEVVSETFTARQRRIWFQNYLDDVVSKEALMPLAEIRFEAELRRLLGLLSARTAQELVIAELAADSSMSTATINNYLGLLEALFLVELIPAWSTNATTRAKTKPKIVLSDPGLAANICNVGEQSFSATSDGKLAGALFDTFVTTELLKQKGWANRNVGAFYFRDRNGAEVDIILEDHNSGEVVGIEVKLSSSPTVAHAKHLAMLRDKLGKKFVQGFVVNTSEHMLPLGDRIWAIPVSALWSAH